MKPRNRKYSTEIRVVRYGTLTGRWPFGVRHKIANIDRGTNKSIQHEAYNEQDFINRWLGHNFPEDVWSVSTNRAENDLDGYELWVTLHETYEDPPIAGNDPERRATRTP